MAEQPVEQSAEQFVELLVEQPEEMPVEQPVDGPFEQPVEQSDEVSVELPLVQSVEQPMENPMEADRFWRNMISKFIACYQNCYFGLCRLEVRQLILCNTPACLCAVLLMLLFLICWNSCL